MIVLQALDRITLVRTRSRLRRTLIPVARHFAACSDPTTPPEPPAVPTGDAECVRDDDCALLPYATCCGECPPEPPYEAGSRQELDAIFIELESRCGLDRRPCEPPVCVARPAGCYVRAACRAGECVAETDGPCGITGSGR
jgi:hypothetical protein